MADKPKLSTVDRLAIEVETTGLTPGTREFELALLQSKIIRCQEHRGLESCRDCPALFFCPLPEQFMTLNRQGGSKNEPTSSSRPDAKPTGSSG